jgi:hypothetical protein
MIQVPDLVLIDQDPGGPKIYGSGSGSATLGGNFAPRPQKRGGGGRETVIEPGAALVTGFV